MQSLGVVFCLYCISLEAQTVIMGYALGNMQKFVERFDTDVLSFRASTFKLSLHHEKIHAEAHAVNYLNLLGAVNEQVIQPVNKTSKRNFISL